MTFSTRFALAAAVAALLSRAFPAPAADPPRKIRSKRPQLEGSRQEAEVDYRRTRTALLSRKYFSTAVLTSSARCVNVPQPYP